MELRRAAMPHQGRLQELLRRSSVVWHLAWWYLEAAGPTILRAEAQGPSNAFQIHSKIWPK